MSFNQRIASIATSGTLYNTYTTAKSLLTSATSTGASAGYISLPAGSLQLGTEIEINFWGGCSWASGNTMTFSVNVGSTSVYSSGAMKVTTTGGTLIPLRGSILLRVDTVGNGTLATMYGLGTYWGRMIVPAGATAGADYSAGSGVAMGPDSAPAASTGFDSTVANTLDLLLAMGTSSASNGFQLRGYTVDIRGNVGP